MQRDDGRERGRALPAFTPLTLGSVRPRGWLLAQLRLQADGLTGLLERVWPDVGPSSGWLGGSGESWERGPYYCDGLVPLAWLLGDDALQQRARTWVEWTLASQRPDGSFGPAANADWWPRVVMLGVLEQYHCATGDERVPPFVERFLRHLDEHLADRPFDMWAVARAGEYLAPILATHARTGGEWLLDLADRVLAAGTDWPALYRDWPYAAPAARLGWGRVLRRYLPWHARVGGWARRVRPAGGGRDRSAASVRRANALAPLVFYHATHGVNHAMALRVPAYRAALGGEAGPLADADLALSRLLHDHGSVLGLPVADEHLAGRSPVHGIELCAVVETMRSLQVLVSVSGEGRWADLLERVALNALPAALAPDVRSHQYYQQVTQVEVTRRRRPWFNAGTDGTLFGLEPTYGCCTANLHQGWPRLAATAVQRSADGGLVVVTLLPCSATTEVGGLRFGVEVSTDYPFAGEVSVTVAAPDGPVDAPLRLRVPGWAEGAELRVAGRRVPDPVLRDGFAVLARRWQDGDTVHLRLPMAVRVERAPFGDTPRPADGVVLLRGPLVLALALAETWTALPGPGQLPDWEVRTDDRWNVALCAEAVAEPGRLPVTDRGVDAIPYSHERPAIEVVVPAREMPAGGCTRARPDPCPTRPPSPSGRSGRSGRFGWCPTAAPRCGSGCSRPRPARPGPDDPGRGGHARARLPGPDPTAEVPVCRWLAYSGSPLPLENLVSRPANSLIHQSRESAMGATALNADGFGVGWYVPGDPVPALFRSVQPAWADANLGELARHVCSPLFLAHVRATTGTPVQQTNCHPFRHEGWLWCHNGAVRDFARVKRDLVLAIDPQLFPGIVGSTDSEVLFHLALTFGLREDPVTAVETMIGHVEQVGRAHGVEQPIQMTVATTDGTRLWAFRHSSEQASRSLFYSTDVATLRRLHPEVPGLREVSDETRLVVSEPLFDLSGAWVEVPESSYVIVEDGQDEIGPLAASRGGRL